MVVAVVMEHGSANSVAFGEYVLLAAGNPVPESWQTKGIGIAALTFACILHAIFPKAGTRLMNLLGVFKIILILVIIFAGFAALGGHLKIPKPDNFTHLFENSSVDVYDYVIALNFVNFSYSGWQSANYVYLFLTKNN
jgi:amino acid transporter